MAMNDAELRGKIRDLRFHYERTPDATLCRLLLLP